MLRLVVALYLMIAAAVGPAACCCTFSRLTGRFAETPSSPVPQPAPASCCQHGSGGQPPAEAPERTPSPDRPDSPDCPCKQAGGCVTVALPANHDEGPATSVRAAFGGSFCPPVNFSTGFAQPASVSPVFRESALLGPSVSTDDLLYAFHILRC